MTEKNPPTSLAEAIKRDTLEGRRDEGLNPGDKARWLVEDEAAQTQAKADLERAVDQQVERLKREGKWL